MYPPSVSVFVSMSSSIKRCKFYCFLQQQHFFFISSTTKSFNPNTMKFRNPLELNETMWKKASQKFSRPQNMFKNQFKSYGRKARVKMIGNIISLFILLELYSEEASLFLMNSLVFRKFVMLKIRMKIAKEKNRMTQTLSMLCEYLSTN